ncbi:DUF4232 domain-containing protein [Streptomyces sp. CL12-4]|uniref:DUF4232 domain-containing protein n=1 Tax=Streptomyces sp. CL12-4 TaxID=2810306 RepID=UPI001EFA9FB5|nr:DUF4232 domain-containing protein [Streptomyces sp. CL12-4]MCG8966250.1 DUF4232 domain-containing protein [Streptomyces sp. CL12-4]
MSARTTRTRLFAATTVALAALALTACEGGSDTGAESGPSTSATATGQNTPSAGASASTGGDKGSSGTTTGSGTDTHGSTGSTGSAGSAGSSGSGGKDASSGSAGGNSGSGAQGSDDEDDMPGKCSASDVKITAQKLSRPLNHLLLTATNTGSKTCMLPPYPAARFGEAQSVPPVAEATKPQSLTGVAPGESGYAGVLLSAGDGSGENGYETNTLTIPFEDGSIATVALPAGGVYVDTALTVTYWQTDVDAALGF